MTKKDTKKMPHVEDDDFAPILAPHLEDQKKIPEFVSKPAPATKSPTPKKQTPEKILEERFTKAIKIVIDLERRPEWRELMQETSCFGKLWKDPDTDKYCDLLDCDLRQFCQITWEKVVGGLEAGEVAPTMVWDHSQGRKVVGRPQKKGKRYKKYAKRAKWGGTGKYTKVPYQDIGRPIDHIALLLSVHLCPSVLPDCWKYPVSKTKEQRSAAAKLFIEEFGDGVFVTKRASYHQYLFQGSHLMRLWVNAAGGGWLDCSVQLAHALVKSGKIDVVRSPVSGYKTKFRFYPHRVFVGREKDVEQIKEALQLIEGLVK